ncbi:2-hydroxycarboxylate transporter family protein [Parendozoicomonas sp. Alg238-R29]|uniref:2-hydroxycarboxylate transporter family protein n=1 Tax=Parendozoicomonas sp. Alg238-R29 TaxID=2993446 RepID=UPI00248E1C4C|nr:2-hydroxycarboxylate transporter family protein [Parendozoicomonas sp. Alg238-R29]
MTLPRILGLPAGLLLGAIVTLLLAHYYNVLPSGLPGALAICLVIGAVLGEIGNRLPIWNKYIGGGPILVFLGAAGMVYMGWLTDREITAITGLIKGSQYIDLFIAVLIFGNILAIQKSMLVRSLVGYIPAILLAVTGAAVLGIMAGLLVGIAPEEIIMLYVLPIMGGGNGAGAIPLSEIYESATGQPRDIYYSKAISILTIANILSILASSLLDRLGKRYPNLSGEGLLVRGSSAEENNVENDGKYTSADLVGGLILAVVFYVLAELFAKVFLPGFGDVQIHRYAWLVLLVAALNVSGLVPLSLRSGARRVADFFSNELLWVLMVGVGVAYTSMEEIIAAINPTTIFVSALIVVGAILGGAIGGRLFGFYEIESAISAGLCMANRGGSGDIEVLAAANRMKLLSYAQISSRLGGGIILAIGAVFFSMYG